MKKIWSYREVDAPAADVWELLTNPEQWPAWGPSVRSATLDVERMQVGATGSVKTAVGGRLGFEITHYDEGHRWAWKVAGIDATDHSVEPLADDSCRVGFGVPWIVAPYQVVCQVALHRIKTLAEQPGVSV